MKYGFGIVLSFVLGVVTAYSAVRYSLNSTANAYVRTYMDSYTDTRDGEVYRVFHSVRIYYPDTVSPYPSIGHVYMFADNLRYRTESSICAEDSCRSYGRYYSLEDAKKVCPDGWHVATARQMNLFGRRMIFSDTAYVGDWRMIRRARHDGEQFPPDGTKIDKHADLPDYPTGWYDTAKGRFEYVGQAGMTWARSEIYDGFEPAYAEFMIMSMDELDSILANGAWSMENKYPVKCFKVVTRHPDVMDDGIVTGDWYGG